MEAQALVNGTTIRQVEEWDEPTITFYSIELEEHSLMWANGLLTETFVATERDGAITRTSWNNYDEYLALYGSSTPMADMPMPRIPFARQLPGEIRAIAGLDTVAAEPEFALV